MIRALIFDFNGVLADDDPIHMEAFRKVAAEEGLSFTDEEYLEKYLPLNDRDCFKILFYERSLELPSDRLQTLINRKGIYYFQMIAQKAVLFDKTAAAVRAAARRYPLAIASGARGEEIRHILRQDGLEGCFSAIISAEDLLSSFQFSERAASRSPQARKMAVARTLFSPALQTLAGNAKTRNTHAGQ